MRSRQLPCTIALVALGCRPGAQTQDPGSGAGAGSTGGAFVEHENPPAAGGADPAAGAAAPLPITCERPADFGPVVVDAEQYARRYAATAARFSEVASTKEQPAEECGIAAGVELLLALTCDDGSRPFSSGQHAHSSRSGNVGSGGRCGSIIDLYVVPCPEATYQIYIDSYICADLEMFR